MSGARATRLSRSASYERPSRYHCAHSRTIEIGDVPATLIHTLLHGSPYEVELQMVAGQPWRGLPDVDESYTDAATWAVIQLE